MHVLKAKPMKCWDFGPIWAFFDPSVMGIGNPFLGPPEGQKWAFWGSRVQCRAI